MENFIELIGITVVVFASTNIDDIFVLLGFFSDPKIKTRQVLIGQYIGIGGLYGVSVVASLLSLVVSPAYIGLLGLAPIGIGLKKLWNQRQGVVEDGDESESPKMLQGNGQILTVATVTLANGGDNISIYTPIFATRSGVDIAIFGVVFAVMTLAWLAAALWLTNHRTVGAPIRRYGHRVVPYVLIGLGIMILYEAGTLTLFRR